MPELIIYEDIGQDWFGDGVTAKKIHSQLEGLEGDLTIRVNSYGGDVFEGHAIYNLIKNYKGNKKVIIDGIAASAASVIAMAGDEVEMPINSMMMIHDPWTFAIGNSEDMLKTAEILDQIKQTIVNVYKDKTGLDDQQLMDMMREETWLDADQAESFGFAVKTEKQTNIENLDKRKWINKIPDIPETEKPEKKETLENKKEYPNNAARLRYLEIEAEAC